MDSLILRKVEHIQLINSKLPGKSGFGASLTVVYDLKSSSSYKIHRETPALRIFERYGAL